MFRLVVTVLIASMCVLVGQETEDLLDLSLDDLLNMEVTVASTKAENVFSSASTVSVIDREFIEKYNFQSVGEAIKTAAGIDITRTYLKRDVPTSRGILNYHYANKILVMINNVPVWHAVTGEPVLNRIDINDIERIEILRGPASVLYGTNAYSGAVNVVLKKPSDHRGWLATLSAGNGNYMGAGISLPLNFGGWQGQVFLNYEDAEGHEIDFTDEAGATSSLDEYDYSSNATLTLFNENHSFLVNYYDSHESYLGVTPKFSSGAGNDHWSKGYLVNYRYSRMISDDTDFRYALTYDLHERDLSRSADDNTRANILGDRLQNSLRVLYSFNPAVDVEIGGDYEVRKSENYHNYTETPDEILTENNLADREVKEGSLFGQFSYTQDKFRIVAGSRYTDNDLFGDNISSRLTGVFTLNERNAVKLIFGQAFRAPSLFEQYFKTDSWTVVGTEDLEPETSSSLELVYLTAWENLFVQALVYNASYENKIFRNKEYHAEPDDVVSVYRNGDKFTANGLELELKYQNPKWINCFANYYFVDGDDGDQVEGTDHYNFKHVSQHNLTAGVSKKLGRFGAAVMFDYVSETDGPFDTVDGYLTINLNLQASHSMGGFTLRSDLYFGNLTDEEVFIPEYVRRKTLNEIPAGIQQEIRYTLTIQP